jgi:hypothetical protein
MGSAFRHSTFPTPQSLLTLPAAPSYHPPPAMYGRLLATPAIGAVRLVPSATEGRMNEKAAWAIGLGLLLGSLLMAGCSTCGPWGCGPAPYAGGYGPAAGGTMSASPPANYGQPLSAQPGWRPSGAAQPASGGTVTP